MTTAQTGIASLRELAAFGQQGQSAATSQRAGAHVALDVIALDPNDTELASALALLMDVESGGLANHLADTDLVVLRQVVGRVLGHFDDRQSPHVLADSRAGDEMGALTDALMLVGQRMIAHGRADAAEDVIAWLEGASTKPEVLRVLWGIYLLEAGEQDRARPWIEGLHEMTPGDETLYLEALVESAANPAGASAALQRVMAICTAQHVRELASQSLQRASAVQQ